MTEAEWQYGENPALLVEHVRGKTTERKLRLFACGCCRLIWHLMDDEQCRKAVEVVEKYADGKVSQKSLRIAYNRASVATSAANKSALGAAESPFGVSLAGEIATCAADAVALPAHDLETAYLTESRKQSHLCRDIFGNPFRSVGVLPSWLTSTVVALATDIYEDRAFDRLPILADALMDAGCANDELLSHLRSDGPHVRGCWALDLVLGKS